MIETNMMIQRSILLYVLVINMPKQAMVTITAPTLIGIPNSIRRAMAPPKISANEVETLASIAEIRIGRLNVRGIYLFVASDRQSPVTIPK